MGGLFGIVPPLALGSSALGQDLRHGQWREQIAIAGPQAGYSPSIGLGPQPADGHAQAARHVREGQQIGMDGNHASYHWRSRKS